MVTATYHAKGRVDSVIDLARKMENDTHKDERLDAQLCKACFYSTAFGGSAMTQRPCMSCGEDQMYASTYTDVLCKPCAVEGKLCKHCGGDIDIKIRRRNWPEGTK